jgi:hypothetical protein
MALASQAGGVRQRTGFKWLASLQGWRRAGLGRSQFSPAQQSTRHSPSKQDRVEQLRRQRWLLWRRGPSLVDGSPLV